MAEEKNYWFKRKRYGYGWVPSTWQGTLACLMYVLILVLSAFIFLRGAPEDEFTTEIGLYYIIVMTSTALLLIICNKKGPKPRWRWGQKESDSPDEDY